ncbi:hypothetical protein LSTR_LSTR016311 [Laodelphax striatellus]|uniref:EGF-like domain-containing protein n=1 Tax=Laodelphax striatellus TaxID=195883 RepID=A0A482WSA4_LAOST|nr:hypothetical protein LSTR_LSTR016311 [Laodelphax striatellus]
MSYGVVQNFTIRTCQKIEDCGRGETCSAVDISKATCDCTHTDADEKLIKPIYTPDANGICDKIVTDQCAKIECTGICLPLLGSYYCECSSELKGRNCELQQTDTSRKRASKLAVAFTFVQRYLTERVFLVFVESFGTDFELILFYKDESIPYLPKDFIFLQSARNECLRLKISKDVCLMTVPDKPMYGLKHVFHFEYQHEDYYKLFPKGHGYRITLVLRNYKEVQFTNQYLLLSTVEHPCTPTASMDNCGCEMNNMVRKPRGSTLRIKASIFPSLYCGEPKSIHNEWKLYSVSSTVNVKMVNPPLASKIGGSYYDIGAFSYPSGLYRIEVWLTALESNDTYVKAHTNFAHCYFEIVDMPLQADIKGGISRSVHKGAPLTLDASGSYNHNTPTQDDLRYLWSCDSDIPACKEREVADPLFIPALNNFGGEITTLHKGEEFKSME